MQFHFHRLFTKLAAPALLALLCARPLLVSAGGPDNTAPTIVGISSTIVIGDSEGGDANNDFVHPTDINLEFSVADDDPATSMTWTYKATGSQQYTINDAPPAANDATDTELTTPATWLYKSGASNANDPADLPGYPYQHFDSDNAPKTITIRNNTLSPAAGFPYASPGAAGHVSGSDGVLELIVSDGIAVGPHKLISVFSVNDGVDATTGCGSSILGCGNSGGCFVPLGANFTDGTHGWTTIGGGTILSSVDETLGLCIQTTSPASAQGDLHWDSAPDLAFSPSADNNSGWITLVGNAAYRVRTTMSTTAEASATAATQPMTLMQWVSKLTTYGGANLYLDNSGHANSFISGFKPTVDTWITPPGVPAGPWKDGLPASGDGSLSEYPAGLAPGTDNVKYNLDFDFGTLGVVHAGYVMDFKIFFRVYDVGDASSGNFNSDLRNGAVCMKCILVDRFGLDDLIQDETVYDTADYGGILDGEGLDPESNEAVGKWTVGDVYSNTDVNFNGGILSMTPSTSVAGGWGSQALIVARPGTGKAFKFDADANSPTFCQFTGFTSAAPIPWVSDQILIAKFYLSCGTTSDHVGRSVDNIMIGFDSPVTVETAGVSYMTGNVARAMTTDAAGQEFNNRGVQPFGPGMPKFTPEPWTVIYNANARTLANTLTYPAGSAVAGKPIFVNADRLRPRIDLAVNLTSTNGNRTSPDGVKLHRVKVDAVHVGSGGRLTRFAGRPKMH